MNLAFSHTGKRFFFITLVLEGRPEVLSELVDEHHRPKLTALGEIVKAAFVAVHQVWPAATLSDFVIMPDHLHFILIVNYEVSPDFNPLFASHALMSAIEQGWAEITRHHHGQGSGAPNQLNPHHGQGSGAPEPPAVLGATSPRNLRGHTPEPPTSLPNMVALLRQALEEARAIAAEINRLKRERGLSREAALVEIARANPAYAARFWRNPRIRPYLLHGRGSGVPEPPEVLNLPRFDRHCYIELAFVAPMLRTIRHYLKLNPARKLWKLAHPDRFLCHPNITAQLLKRLPPRRWQGMGNLTLLGSPFLFHVRLTLKKSVAEHEAAIREIVEKAKHGWVPVSGFISPGEVEALRRLKATPGTRFIKMLPCALPPRYDPSAEDSRELAADRLLILSGFAETPAVPARDIRKYLAASHQFRANCLAMNDLAAALCSVATGA